MLATLMLGKETGRFLGLTGKLVLAYLGNSKPVKDPTKKWHLKNVTQNCLLTSTHGHT